MIIIFLEMLQLILQAYIKIRFKKNCELNYNKQFANIYLYLLIVKYTYLNLRSFFKKNIEIKIGFWLS